MEPLITIPSNHPDIVYGLSGPTWLETNGVAIFVAGKEPEHTLLHAKSQIEAFERICGRIPRPVLADFTNLKAMSRDAREYYTGKGNIQKITALGIVSASKMGLFVANFFVGVNLQTDIPIRICRDVDQATQWLTQFIKR